MLPHKRCLWGKSCPAWRAAHVVASLLPLGPTLPNRLVPDKAEIGIADFG